MISTSFIAGRKNDASEEFCEKKIVCCSKQNMGLFCTTIPSFQKGHQKLAYRFIVAEKKIKN